MHESADHNYKKEKNNPFWDIILDNNNDGSWLLDPKWIRNNNYGHHHNNGEHKKFFHLLTEKDKKDENVIISNETKEPKNYMKAIRGTNGLYSKIIFKTIFATKII